MQDDAELLRRYVLEKSDAAFGEIVRKHLTLVYSVALRQVAGDLHLAEDVTQQVFTALARKAEMLSHRPSVSGWLYRSTHFAASDLVRAERRRRTREQEAFNMDSPANSSDHVDWDRIRPVLDAAIADLGERDRDAISLRFLEGRSFAEIGAKLQSSENTARMRVERALDKLHAALTRRGVTSTAAAIGIAVANQASMAAPLGMAANVTSSALASVSSGTAFTTVGFFLMNKISTAIVGAVALTASVVGYEEVRANRELRAELRPPSVSNSDLVKSQEENRSLNAALKSLGLKNPEAEELARLQERATRLSARPPGVLDSELQAAASWSNVGRATPEAATRTFHWAMYTDNLDTVAQFVNFDDDTRENREAFMAYFSETVRARYRTPERLFAAAFFGTGTKNTHAPNDALQILGVDDRVGGNGSRYGQKRVRVWYSLASGKEFEGSTRWQPTPDGWSLAAVSLSKEWKYALSVIDPATGDRVVEPQKTSSPR